MNVLPDFDKVAAILQAFEGYEEKAYKDSGGVWTIGFGSTYNFDAKRKVLDSDIVTKQQAISWMAKEMDNVVKQLNQYIKIQLNPDQAAALTDYCYNRGIGNLLKTQLAELINADPFNEQIASEIIGTGLKDRMGNLLWGLGRRRRAEAYLYFTGKIKTDWPKWGEFTYK